MDPTNQEIQSQPAPQITSEQPLPPQTALPESPPPPSAPMPPFWKGKKFLLLLLLIVLIAVGAGGYVLGTSKIPSKTPTTPTSTPSEAVSPTKSAGTQEDITAYPVYPGATFLAKAVHDVCPTDIPQGPPTICNTTSYEYSTSDTWDIVYAWFKVTTKHNEWTCGGGAGIAGESSTTTCEKDGKIISVYIDSITEKSATHITYYIPNSTKKVTPDTTSSWKTQTMPLYGLSVQTPADWLVTEKNRRPEPTGAGTVYGHDCATYEVTDSTRSIILTLTPPCGFDEGVGDKLPSDAVFVTKQSNTASIYRVYNSPTSIFQYGTNYTNSNPPEMSFIPVIIFGEGNSSLTVHNTLSVSSTSSKKEALLQTMDKVISTLTKK